jgi:hypothetical protein
MKDSEQALLTQTKLLLLSPAIFAQQTVQLIKYMIEAHFMPYIPSFECNKESVYTIVPGRKLFTAYKMLVNCTLP